MNEKYTIVCNYQVGPFATKSVTCEIEPFLSEE